MTPSSMTLHYLGAIEFTNASVSSLANYFINGELGTPNQSVSPVITLYVSALVPHATHTQTETNTFKKTAIFPK